MTYLDLIRNADYKLDNDAITLGEYEQMIEPLNREIQPEHKWYIRLMINIAIYLLILFFLFGVMMELIRNE